MYTKLISVTFIRKISLYFCCSFDSRISTKGLFIQHQVPSIQLGPTLNIQLKRGQRRFRAVSSQNSYSHHNYTLGDERILLRACVSSFSAVCLTVMTQSISPTVLSCFQPSHKSLRGADRERAQQGEEKQKRGGWKQKALWSADTLEAFGGRVRKLKRKGGGGSRREIKRRVGWGHNASFVAGC